VTDRRQALLGAAALAVAAATGVSLLRERTALPARVPIPSAPGFLRLEGAGSLSGGAALSAGLEARGDGPASLTAPELCATLFRAGGPGLPVAAFTDYYCPACPALAPLLADPGLPPLAITWHEWPVLGQRSDFAARVALAVGAQLPGPEAYGEVHDALMRRRPRPSPEGAAAAAEALDLDPAPVLDAVHSPQVDLQLRATARAARQLGLAGTPSVVVGRVVVSGLPAARTLRRLAEAEAAARRKGAGACPGTGRGS